MVNPDRIRPLKEGVPGPGSVVYWMSRDQRVADNWALLHARHVALSQGVPLAVVFCLVPEFLNGTIRQYRFMLEGLKGVEEDLGELGIAFFLISGYPEEEIPKFCHQHGIGALITDFDPLRLKRTWKMAITDRVNIPIHEVDAHNIIPCWIASSRQEYGAYTIRPKIKRLLPAFLEDFPAMEKHAIPWLGMPRRTDWEGVEGALTTDRTVPAVAWLSPGAEAAKDSLSRFIEGRLEAYSRDRNDPNKVGQSNLSPYLHFGQLSAQRVALEVLRAAVTEESRAAFLDELIVRRELSDNFCFYTPHYDSFEGFPDWAKKTLTEHRKDRRSYIYPRDALEAAETHDDLWNAAQTEMVKKGKMHGYMRMYWAKKLLEWTKSPEDAMKIAIYLNDRYELDGRDPNGYAGIAWSIGGVHDRAWSERNVFGKVRYMSYNGLKSKFNASAYIKSAGSP
ncbi:MAG TPA: deoxyribodipyrimidine photolyase [Syntrophorhabdus aromaticivorans]|nr:deoxyribodipyrimidine photolyase [Syntrophorhabdus aromaticivorans]